MLGLLQKLVFCLFAVILVISAQITPPKPDPNLAGKKRCRKCGESGKPICPSECDKDYSYEYCEEDLPKPVAVSTSTADPTKNIEYQNGNGNTRNNDHNRDAQKGEVICWSTLYYDTDWIAKGCINNYEGKLECHDNKPMNTRTCYCRNNHEEACNAAPPVKPDRSLFAIIIILVCVFLQFRPYMELLVA